MKLEAMVRFAAVIGYVELAKLAIDEAYDAGHITKEEADNLRQLAGEIHSQFG